MTSSLTTQALVTLMDWASQNTKPDQERFSVYLSNLIEEHYAPKEMTISRTIMERIIENYEEETKK